MPTLRSTSRTQALAVLLSCSLAGGCLAPPALLPPYDVDLERALAEYPPGTEKVELALSADDRLRGLFVPSDAGAPVVLHLLESSGSVGSCRFSYGELCSELSESRLRFPSDRPFRDRDLGWRSLRRSPRARRGGDKDRRSCAPRLYDVDHELRFRERRRRHHPDGPRPTSREPALPRIERGGRAPATGARPHEGVPDPGPSESRGRREDAPRGLGRRRVETARPRDPSSRAADAHDPGQAHSLTPG